MTLILRSTINITYKSISYTKPTAFYRLKDRVTTRAQRTCHVRTCGWKMYQGFSHQDHMGTKETSIGCSQTCKVEWGGKQSRNGGNTWPEITEERGEEKGGPSRKDTFVCHQTNGVVECEDSMYWFLSAKDSDLNKLSSLLSPECYILYIQTSNQSNRVLESKKGPLKRRWKFFLKVWISKF